MPVYLIGAGPGDPDLITVRGRDLLARADAILYDQLIDPRLLRVARRDAELVYVGKAKRPGAPLQEEINALLVRCGRQYECVVRLKGGDPFVFGRGGEEALALRAAGIPFEIVPGVSSAVAAPASAGIPVTHRGLAASVAIVAGHEAADKSSGDVRWDQLATAADSLVILMGVETLDAIAAMLIAHGRPPETPAAVIERATWPDQRVVVAPLIDIATQAQAAGIRAPATAVVGDVVGLHQELGSFGLQPHTEASLAVGVPLHPQSRELAQAGGHQKVLSCQNVRSML